MTSNLTPTVSIPDVLTLLKKNVINVFTDSTIFKESLTKRINDGNPLSSVLSMDDLQDINNIHERIIDVKKLILELDIMINTVKEEEESIIVDDLITENTEE